MGIYLEKGIWEIARCYSCGLVFVKNIPSEDELKKTYGEDFFNDVQKSPLKGSILNHNPSYMNARRRLKTIRKIGPQKGKLLDIGCATGIFLKATKSFYDGTGLDISQYATDFAVQNLGVKAYCGSIFDTYFEARSFDVITMWDVIEHVTDPNKYIQKTSKIIRPGGLLVLSTGNIDSLMFKAQGKKWHLLIPPMHLFYFNPNSIKRLLAQNGFNVIKISFDGQYTNIGYIINKLKRLHAKNKYVEFLGTIAKMLKLDRVNIFLNLYDVMTIYAKRNGRYGE